MALSTKAVENTLTPSATTQTFSVATASASVAYISSMTVRGPFIVDRPDLTGALDSRSQLIFSPNASSPALLQRAFNGSAVSNSYSFLDSNGNTYGTINFSPQVTGSGFAISVASQSGTTAQSRILVDRDTSEQTFSDHAGTFMLRMSTDNVNFFNTLSLRPSGRIGVWVSTPSWQVDISTTRLVQSAVIDRTASVEAQVVAESNQVYTAGYYSVRSTGTTDNTGNAAHMIAGLYRSSDTIVGGTDMITLEARNDARTTISNVEHTGILGYIDVLVPTGPASGIYTALRARGCVSSNGDCGTDVATGTVYGLLIEDIQGGANTSRAILQLGTDDFNMFLGSHTSFGSSTINTTARVTLTQAGGAAVTAALMVLSGSSSDYTYMGIGRTVTEYYLGVSAANDQFLQGNIAGDAFIGTGSTSNDLAFASGLNALPELRIANDNVIVSTAGALIIPQQSAPTITSAGAVGVDTSSRQFVWHDGSAARVMESTPAYHHTITGPTAGNYPLFARPATDITLTSLVCVSSAATSATIEVRECNASGASCTAINTAAACTTTNTAIALTDTSIAAGNRIRVMVTAVSGTPGYTEVDLYYQETRK